MQREEFYFDSRDGQTKIHAVLWKPDAPPKAILQIVHGMAEYILRYDRLACWLAEREILVTGEDHLGHGDSIHKKNGEADQPLGYFCAHDPATVVVRDVHRLKKMVQERYPNVPYLILGHSMGSFLARNYLCRYGTGIDGAVLMGTGMQSRALLKLGKGVARVISVFRGTQYRSALVDHMAFGGYNARIPHPATDMDWLSRDGKEVEKYLADPLCGFRFTLNGFATLFELVDRLYDPELLQKMPKELPVLFLAGEDDPVGAYGSAVRRVAEQFRALGMEQTDCKLYPGMRHELVNETGREEVAADLLSWIEKTAAKAVSLR